MRERTPIPKLRYPPVAVGVVGASLLALGVAEPAARDDQRSANVPSALGPRVYLETREVRPDQWLTTCHVGGPWTCFESENQSSE